MAEQLTTRGYAVVELPEHVTQLYSDFHLAFEVFSHQSIQTKEFYATQQFDVAKHRLRFRVWDSVMD